MKGEKGVTEEEREISGMSTKEGERESVIDRQIRDQPVSGAYLRLLTM